MSSARLFGAVSRQKTRFGGMTSARRPSLLPLAQPAIPHIAFNWGDDSLPLAGRAKVRGAEGYALFMRSRRADCPRCGTARVKTSRPPGVCRFKLVDAVSLPILPSYRRQPGETALFCKSNLYGTSGRADGAGCGRWAPNTDIYIDYRPVFAGPGEHGVLAPFRRCADVQSHVCAPWRGRAWLEGGGEGKKKKKKTGGANCAAAPCIWPAGSRPACGLSCDLAVIDRCRKTLLWQSWAISTLALFRLLPELRWWSLITCL